MVRLKTTFLQGVSDLVIDSLNLPLGITTADDKIVSKATYLARIQKQNIASLLVASRFYGLTGNLYRFQPIPPIRKFQPKKF